MLVDIFQETLFVQSIGSVRSSRVCKIGGNRSVTSNHGRTQTPTNAFDSLTAPPKNRHSTLPRRGNTGGEMSKPRQKVYLCPQNIAEKRHDSKITPFVRATSPPQFGCTPLLALSRPPIQERNGNVRQMFANIFAFFDGGPPPYTESV